tara:strand:- start:2147 stop:2383 length:237 start_codon:yes stop_codon:yes gene_type:complete
VNRCRQTAAGDRRFLFLYQHLSIAHVVIRLGISVIGFKRTSAIFQILFEGAFIMKKRPQFVVCFCVGWDYFKGVLVGF